MSIAAAIIAAATTARGKAKRGRGRPPKQAYYTLLSAALNPGKGWRKGLTRKGTPLLDDTVLRPFAERVDAIKAGRRMSDKAAIEEDMRAWFRETYPKGSRIEQNGKTVSTVSIERWVARNLPRFQIKLSQYRTRIKRHGPK